MKQKQAAVTFLKQCQDNEVYADFMRLEKFRAHNGPNIDPYALAFDKLVK
jgi:hypothetical protein